MRGKAVIAGIGHTAFGKQPGRSTVSLNIEAYRNAVADAGIEKNAVDGLLVKVPTSKVEMMYGQKLAEAMGMSPRFGGVFDQRKQFLSIANRQFFAKQTGKAQDDGQGIVEIVSDAGSQAAQRLHLLRKNKALLETALASHVGELPEHAAILQGAQGHVQVFAVQFESKRFDLQIGRPQRLGNLGPPRLAEQLHHRILAQGLTQNFFAAFIEKRHPAGAVGAENSADR